MNLKHFALASVLAAGLAVAGCGGSSEEPVTPPADVSGPKEPAASTATPPVAPDATTPPPAEQPKTPPPTDETAGPPVPKKPTAPMEPVVYKENGKVVCVVMAGMEIRDTAGMKFQDFEGVRYYFCCDDCPPKFKADPKKYAKKPAAKSQ
jgi:YHS domain-containing protein